MQLLELGFHFAALNQLQQPVRAQTQVLDAFTQACCSVQYHGQHRVEGRENNLPQHVTCYSGKLG